MTELARTLELDMSLPMTSFAITAGEDLGRKRWAENIRQGWAVQRDWKGHGEPNHILGAQAELAIARALNLYPDLQDIDPGPVDLTLPSGQTIAVKQSKGCDLNVPQWQKTKPCDFYLLVIGDHPRAFRFGGWAPRADVFLDGNLQQRHNVCYVVPRTGALPRLRAYFSVRGARVAA